MAQRAGGRRLRRLRRGQRPAQDSGRYSLPLEHAAVLADEPSPAYRPGVFQNALGSVIDSPRITDAVKTGAGVGWYEHSQDVFDGCGGGPVHSRINRRAA